MEGWGKNWQRRTKMGEEEIINKKERLSYFSLVFLEILLFFLFFFFSYDFSLVLGGVGVDNETVLTTFGVGVTEPVIKYVLVEPTTLTLVPNGTSILNCSAEVENYEGDSDLQLGIAEFFDSSVSFYGDNDDNNSHYTNSSCIIDTDYGDAFTAMVNCSIYVQYNANPGDWNCTINISNSYFWVNATNDTTVSSLLALGLPDNINYGVVNATFVSGENETNVTNYGNTRFNLSLTGYGKVEGDGFAMNCSLGAVGDILAMYEKYNLTMSNPGVQTLSQFEANYTNLTGTQTVRKYDINYRQEEGYNEAVNSTYWRIYVPGGVAGTCTGNIIFGAAEAPGV